MPLSTLKQFIVPQDHLFFELLQGQAETAHEAAVALQDLMHDYKDVDKHAKTIKNLEHKGDELVHTIYEQLNKSFVVPMAHDDVSGLATALDDVLDLTNSSAKYLSVYQIKKPLPAMVELSEILARQTQELLVAVQSLNSPKTFSRATKACVEINRLENEADDAYTHGLVDLFKTDDAVFILKHKEVLDRLESATDRVERAANAVSDILMKHG
ncbi:DUF47 family protein [Candidatus Micrarchaeota archaeon]|nr:DUF47 family protein [Candidatus Micrarchaeota archaeon]